MAVVMTFGPIGARYKGCEIPEQANEISKNNGDGILHVGSTENLFDSPPGDINGWKILMFRKVMFSNVAQPCVGQIFEPGRGHANGHLRF
jgi:hypothetical protein